MSLRGRGRYRDGKPVRTVRDDVLGLVQFSWSDRQSAPYSSSSVPSSVTGTS
jgi:hypothetical protein